MAKKRSEVSLARKFHYFSLAIMEIGECKDFRKNNKVVSIACQYSNHPKLKPQDFEGIADMTLNEILKSIIIENESL